MFIAVTARKEVAQCQRRLVESLRGRLKDQATLTVGHRGESFPGKVFHEPGIWFSTRRLIDLPLPRYWNAFGSGVRPAGVQVITVEVNPPIDGYSPRLAGLFARDDGSGEYVLLHRGRVGGGRKGIGKSAFENWYRGTWVEVVGPESQRDEAILVARLSSRNIVDQLRSFIAEVARFKEEVTKGRKTRSPGRAVKSKGFRPEFHGKKKGQRSGVIEYETYHGLVVNALEAKLKGALPAGGAKIFNDREIDLGVEIRGRLRHLYEVKSTAESQALYTGIGQLMVHSVKRSNVAKTLVLPARELEKQARETLSELGVDVLEYRIVGGKVRFLS